MKKVTLILLLFCAFHAIAQVPQAFNYQAVVRDAQGNPRPNQHFTFEVSIIQNGTPVYSENHSKPTDPFGLIALKVGQGAATYGQFETLNWGNAASTIRVKVNGSLLPDSPILPAPIALYALKSGGSAADSWTTSGANVYRANGNVGIGVTNPIAKLEVGGTIQTEGLRLNGSDLQMGLNDGRSKGNVPHQRALVHDHNDILVVNYAKDFEGGVRIDGNLRVNNEKEFRIDVGTNIAGISNPQGVVYYEVVGGEYHVFGGNIMSDNSYVHGLGVPSNPFAHAYIRGLTRTGVLEITGGSDIVEYRQSKDKPQAGEVVICDPNNTNQVLRSTKAYDKKVLGVVSGAGGINPGMALSQTGKFGGDVPVAMMGTVKVKIVGQVEAGDLLTTSDKAGYAMKAKSRKKGYGTIIGKAISAADKDGLVTMVIQPR